MTGYSDYRRIENVQIRAAERRNNSRNGNPTWALHTSEGTFLTAPDASLGYAIENYTNSRHADTYVIGDNVPAVALLVTSKAARVAYIEKDGEILR